MIVTPDNYEAFYIDYLEGRLSKAEEADLLSFLKLHPQQSAECSNFAFVPLVPFSPVYKNKESLKKLQFDAKINAANVEDFCIAYHEGLLSEAKRRELQLLVQKDRHIETLLAEYSQTILKADSTVVFRHKQKLKKEKKSSLLWVGYGVAASLVIGVGLTFLLRNPSLRNNTVYHFPVSSNPANNPISFEQPLPEAGTLVINIPESATPITDTLRENEPEQHAMPVMAQAVGSAFIASIPKIPEDSVQSETAMWENLASEPEEGNPEVDSTQMTKEEKSTRKGILAVLRKQKLSQISVYGLLRVGINGFGNLTSLKIHMDTQTDSTGRVTAYSISAGRLGYYNTVDL
jgi:hypothetical protein